jgi:hypothetical protein
MDWGIDPDRVAEIAEIVRNRRFSAADSEKFMLAIVGGAGEHADSMLWEMNQILLGLGTLLAAPRMPPRDAAIGCLLDESGLLIGKLRSGKRVTSPTGDVWSDAQGLNLADGDTPRSFSWPRVKRNMGLADFLFMSPQIDAAIGSGAESLRNALDVLFSGEGDLVSLSKRAVQAPARYMRGWRKKYLPLQAFADLIRHREAFLAGAGRTRSGRSLAHDDVLSLWFHVIDAGETWSYGRFIEKLAALLREERTDTDRRAFLAPVSIDDMVTGEPSDDPEEMIIAWLDRDTSALQDNDEAGDIPEQDDGSNEDEAFIERSLAALNALPQMPKVLTKEERRGAAQVLSIIPLAHEQPVTLLRSLSVTPWENRLVEASRRSLPDEKADAFDYPARIGELTLLDRQLAELILMAVHLERGGSSAEGARLLKKWRHDRSSFRMEDAELAQTFARMGQDLRIVAGSLKRILAQLGKLAREADLQTQGVQDEASFAKAFSKRYGKQTETL